MKHIKAIPETLEVKAIDFVAEIFKSPKEKATNIDRLVAAAIIIFRAYLNGRS